MLQIFKPIKKAHKDRQYLREADHTLVHRSSPVVLAHLIFYFSVVYSGNQYALYPVFYTCMATLIFISCGTASVYIYKFDDIYPHGPARWRNLFLSIILLIGLCWSIFISGNTLINGLNTNYFISCLLTFWLCTSVSMVFVPFRFFSYLYISLTFIPLSIVTFSKLDQTAFICAAFLLAYYAVIMVQIQQISTMYWKKLEAEMALNSKEAIIKANNNNAEKARIKNDFLAQMSHELRTPMNSVLGMLSLIGDTPLTKEQKEFQTIASKSGEYLLTLIDDLLDFSKITSAKLILDEQIFNLRNKIEECIEVIAPLAHKKNIEISYSFEADLPTRVKGDANRLCQIIQNLIHRAINITQQGEIALNFSFPNGTLHDSFLKVDIYDQGKPLSADESRSLFNAFYHSKEEDPVDLSNSSLGLVICKGLVERMHGEIGVEYLDGDCNNLWFTAKLHISSQQFQHFVPSKKLANIKILLVNFSVRARKSLENELHQWNIYTNYVDTLDEALPKLVSVAQEGFPFDAMLYNLPLNESSSLGFLHELAIDKRLKGLKQLIALSLIQRGSDEAQLHLHNTPNSAFLTKPYRLSNLYESLLNLLFLETANHKKQHTIEKKENRALPAKHHILLVEDNKVNQMVTMGMLKKLGYETKVANNGMEALRLFDEYDFDMIIMDCQMPEMDGYTATQEIRQREEEKQAHIIIVAMTANVLEGDETKCFAAGMDDYLAKPVNIEELSYKLRFWLANKERMITSSQQAAKH